MTYIKEICDALCQMVINLNIKKLLLCLGIFVLFCNQKIIAFNSTDNSNYTFTNYYYTNNISTNKIISSNIENNKTAISNIKIYKKLDSINFIWKSALCPGLGQLFLKRYTKSIFLYSTFTLSIASGVLYHIKAEKIYQDYLKAKTTTDAVNLYDEYLLKNQLSNYFFYLSIGIWLYNIFDVYLDVKWINENIKLNLYEIKF